MTTSEAVSKIVLMSRLSRPFTEKMLKKLDKAATMVKLEEIRTARIDIINAIKDIKRQKLSGEVKLKNLDQLLFSLQA